MAQHRTPAELTRHQIRSNRRAVQLAAQRAALIQGRALPTRHDPTETRELITTRLVRRAAKVVDADPGLVRWITAEIEAGYARQPVKPGARPPARPRALDVRTGLICFWLLAVVTKGFFLTDLTPLLQGMSWRTRRALGVTYLKKNGQPATITHNQLRDLFHSIRKAFDPFTPGLSDDDRKTREAKLAELSSRWITATTVGAAPWRSGDIAVDATFKWSWQRPPRSGSTKLERRGGDGEGRPPVPLSNIVTDPAEFADSTIGCLRNGAGFVELPDGFPATWSAGAAWVGRNQLANAVHGYALHTAVRSGPGEAPYVEAARVTPANMLPPKAFSDTLTGLYQQRANNPDLAPTFTAGHGRPLGTVVADPAYTMFDPYGWQHHIRGLGGTPIFRPHRNNQEAPRWKTPKTKGAAHPGRATPTNPAVLFVHGRPVCECVEYATYARTGPDGAPIEVPLTGLHVPGHIQTRAQMESTDSRVQTLLDFAWKHNKWTEPADRRVRFDAQFLSPHGANNHNTGGCPHCVDHNGRPRIDPRNGQPRARCCTRRSAVFTGEQLGGYCDPAPGTLTWYDQWNRRSVAEGVYGFIKSAAGEAWNRQYHRYVGLAQETLVTLFMIAAYNHAVYKREQATSTIQQQPPRPITRRNRRSRKHPNAGPTPHTPRTPPRRVGPAPPGRGNRARPGLEHLAPRRPEQPTR
ncbi:MAG TPA: hypothetical protein VFP54_06015 [Acidimicrobiales bacterium]|nr:hypothetical protein [Acidimicrobiales bacterium]